jgi:hypothetical protein
VLTVQILLRPTIHRRIALERFLKLRIVEEADEILGGP